MGLNDMLCSPGLLRITFFLAICFMMVRVLDK